MSFEHSLVIDLSYLHSVAGGNKKFEKDLLQCALNDIDNRMNSLTLAWQQHDFVGIKNSVHSLKSLAAIAGLSEVKKLSTDLDFIFSNGIISNEKNEPFMNLVQSWNVAKPVLNQLIASYQ